MIGAVPTRGRTLILGPSGVGKTRLTAEALERWIDAHGTDRVAVLEFGPEIERDGRVIGGRLERFATLPETVWRGTIEARAPRLEGVNEADQLRLARQNASAARAVIEDIPGDVRAVFGNDVTIPFQAPRAEPARLLERVEEAECVVLNAFDGEELGAGPVLEQERAVLATLREWADTVVELEAD